MNWSAICSPVAGGSERRACDAFPSSRATIRYKSRRPDQASLQIRIKELAATRVNNGYRRIHVLLQREGWPINHKRTRRIYRVLGLQLRNKTPKREVKAKLREDRVQATAPNECWFCPNSCSMAARSEFYQC